MTIHLSKELEQFVHDAILAGRYATEEDVFNDCSNGSADRHRCRHRVWDQSGLWATTPNCSTRRSSMP